MADSKEVGYQSSVGGVQGVLADVELLQEITMASREAVGAFVEDRTDRDGNVSSNALTNLARRGGFGKEPYMKAIEVNAVLVLQKIIPWCLD